MTNQETVKYRKSIIDKYKISVGCYVCGYNKHPSALCFHHLDGHEKHEDIKNGYSKRSSAGGMFRLYSKKYTTEDIINEIRKCRIVCSNCHMEHTHNNTIINFEGKIESIEELYRLLDF
jgi:hypothetical protein